MKIYRAIWSSLDKSEKFKMKILIVLMVFSMIAETLSIGVILPVIGLIVDPNFLENLQINFSFLNLESLNYNSLVVLFLSALVLCFFIKNLYLAFFYWNQYNSVYSIQRSISTKLFYYYLYQPYTFHILRNSSKLIRNVTTEVTQFTLALLSSIILLTEILVILGIVTLLLIIDSQSALIAALFFSLTAIIFQKLTRNKILNWGLNRHRHEGERIQSLQQGLGGIKEVKLYGRENYFANSYDKNNNSVTEMVRNQKFVTQLPRILIEMSGIFIFITMIILISYSGQKMSNIIPTLTIFGASAVRLIPSVNRIMSAVQHLRFSEPVINVMYDELNRINDYRDFSNNDQNLKNLIKFKEKIQLSSIYFKYPESKKDILKNINLIIKKGECVGLVGGSGEGKSTLVDIITGLLKPNIGSITIDDTNINTDLRSYQKIIGYVSQSIYLLDASIKKNIAFGLENHVISNQEIDEVLKKVELFEFVNSLPDGIETNIGERGVKLSGGQRQRLGIARALILKPEIIIFDEATSALDSDTENKIMNAISNLKKEKTILLISHKYNILDFCDQIYNIKNQSLNKI